MVKLIKFYMLSLIIVGTTTIIQAQNNLEISPYVGVNQTLGDFKDFAEQGIVLGLASDYQLSKSFAIGLDVNYQGNSFSNSYDFSRLPKDFLIEANQQGKWGATTIGFGPTYTFWGDKLSLDIYSKAGVSFVNTPESSIVFKYRAAAEFGSGLFQFKEQN